MMISTASTFSSPMAYKIASPVVSIAQAIDFKSVKTLEFYMPSDLSMTEDDIERRELQYIICFSKIIYYITLKALVSVTLAS